MLELRGVRKRFGAVVALDDVSMTVAPGRLQGFVGRNGAGKTTTMRTALGLLQPDAGEVRWHGRPVTPADRASFGYMPEERGLYPKMSARDQLVHFARLSGLNRTAAAAAAARALAALGIEARAGDAVEKLSLGNQQRCQLAVALVASPPLLVLDEPFSGLDPVGVDVLAEVLREEAARGVGVLFSSHQLELVERLCEEVTIIDAGRVVASGPIARLRRERGGDRVRVALDSGDTSWATSVAGVEVVEVAGDEVVLALPPGADDAAVLDAARRAGRLRSYRRGAASLAEVFREVVAP